MAITTDRRSVIGPTSGRNHKGGKLLAADGIPGVIIMLAYYAGRTNLFPEGIGDPEMYVLDHLEEHVIQTDTGHLTELLDALSDCIGQTVGQLGAASFPVYLCALRKGKRPGGQGSGEYPPVKTVLEGRRGLLHIWPRYWERDMSGDSAERNRQILPFWVQALAQQKGL